LDFNQTEHAEKSSHANTCINNMANARVTESEVEKIYHARASMFHNSVLTTNIISEET
jgi:flagellar basal body rod protein FlgC